MTHPPASGSFAGRSRIGRTSVGRSISAAGQFLRRQLWIWPILAALMLAVVAVMIRGILERSLKEALGQNLETILMADVAAMQLWLDSQGDSAWRASMDNEVRRHVAELMALAGEGEFDRNALVTSEPAKELRAALQPWLEGEDFKGYLIFNAQHVVVASNLDELVGKTYPPVVGEAIDRAMAGMPTVTRPFKSVAVLTDATGQERSGVPTMAAAAGVENAEDKIVAVLALRLDPDESFDTILNIGRLGSTGETYAFDDQGLLLSQSRFEDQLKELGLLVDQPDATSSLNVSVRNPGVDMAQGEHPTLRRHEQPLTFAAQEAIAKRPGTNVEGYRDYRGSYSVGAWTWLPAYGFGVITEQDMAEALGPLNVLRRVVWGMFGLLFLSSLAIFIFTMIAARAQQRAREAVLEAKQLGQYALDEKIGEGGMGVVYRAHHALLQRPTAVKLLDPRKTGADAIERFEREVRLCSQLNHPNTIAIYDYGRTPEGVFFYAMEYLDGLSLESLVRNYGPQPEGRVIDLLRQMCGSLAEAHGAGLIHRDIKPANIMLNRRGGLFDYVKLLDFGLVKHFGGQAEKGLTATGSLAGTPLYLSPEQVNGKELDPRSDLYSLGAVGYFLLTGRPVFDGESILDICMQHASAAPEAPSQRLGKPVSSDFEAVLLMCLAKNPTDRPASATELAAALTACSAAATWTQRDAGTWWAQYVSLDTTQVMAAPTQREALTETLMQPPS